MPIPVGELPPAVAEYLGELEARIVELENPGSPRQVFACDEADLPPAADHYDAVLRVRDLNILAASDGADWIRQDTGAAI